MQNLLTLDIIGYPNTQALFKFYIDKGMPVTDQSVMTLNTLLFKYFSKYSYEDVRNQCFMWLVNGDFISVDVKCTKELLLRLISYENINLIPKQDSGRNDLYDTLFNSNERCILFSEFQLEIMNQSADESKLKDVYEANSEIDRVIHDYFKEMMVSCIVKFERKNMKLVEFVKFVNVTVNYLDIILKCNALSDDDNKMMEIFCLIKKALSEMYISLECILKSDNQIATKVELLTLLKTILLADLGPVMGAKVRTSVHKEFFICMNKIIISETKADDEDVVYAGDEKEINCTTLKHNCVLVLAAYCRRKVNFTNELLNFILDPKIYDFATDAQCVFQCLELLTDSDLEDPPSGTFLF